MATAKMTLLEIVQAALRSIGSDNVNAIGDTPESADVAYMVRDVFYELLHGRYWPHLKKVIRPSASGDSSKPCEMQIEDNVQRIFEDTFYYDKRETVSANPDYQLVHWVSNEEFLRLVMPRSGSVSDSNLQSMSTTNGWNIYIYNDRAPKYYTSIDDEILLFDAFDSGVDTTLQQSKAQVMVYEEPTFSYTDGWTPDLPDKVFPLLLAEVKSVVALEIAQEANAKQEQISRRQDNWMAREKYRSRDNKIRYADGAHYGRK
jgi:hypothetical protein